MINMDIKKHIKPISIALLTLLLSACAKNPVTGDSDFVLMSEDQEITLGRQAHPKIIKRYGRYKDPQLQNYVQEIGSKLASKSHRNNLIYRFTVLDSDEVNAFALPGGYIYITRGLLAYINSEAEMAAVLGHEIGHVTARHGARQQSTATLANILGAVIGARTGSSVAQNAGNILSRALISGYGRDHELQADKLGAEYLARSDYDPDAMIDVIRVLKNQELFEKKLAKKENREPRTYHGVFATHPDNDKRLQDVIKAAGNIRSNGINTAHINRDRFIKHIDNLVYGDSEEEGIRRASNFYHKELGFTLKFPDGWRIKNRPNSVIALAPDNKGLLQLITTDQNLKIPPRDFLLKRLNIDALQQGKEITPAGLRGYSAVAPLETPYGERDTRIGIVYYNTKAYILFAANKSSKQAGLYRQSFFNTLNSFHPLNNEELKLAEPLRLKIITLEPSSTIDSLANQSKIPNYPQEQLRLLNNLYPDGKLEPGKKFKIVE